MRIETSTLACKSLARHHLLILASPSDILYADTERSAMTIVAPALPCAA